MSKSKKKIINKKRKLMTKNSKKLNSDESSELTSESILPVVQVLKEVEQLPCSLKQISDLPQQKKEQIKIAHPSLAPYYFLKQRQRAKYFHQLNHKYRLYMKPSKPPGSAPRKKTIKFKKRFQIKLFDKEQNTKKIKQKKTFTERQVRNLHFT